MKTKILSVILSATILIVLAIPTVFYASTTEKIPGVDFEVIQDYEGDDAPTLIKNIINWYDHQTAEIATGTEAIMENASAKFVYTSLPGEVMASSFYNNPIAPTISNAKGVFARVRTTVQAGAELQFIFDNYDHAGGTTVFVKLDGTVSYGGTPCDNFDGYLFLPADDVESNLNYSLIKELGLRSTTWGGLQTATGTVLVDHVGYYTMDYFRDEDEYRALVDAIDLPIGDVGVISGVDFEVVQDYEGDDATTLIKNIINWYDHQTAEIATGSEAIMGNGSAKFIYTALPGEVMASSFFNNPIAPTISNAKGVFARVRTTVQAGAELQFIFDNYDHAGGTTVFVKLDGTVSYGGTPCDNFDGYLFLPADDAESNLDFSLIKELGLRSTTWGGLQTATGTVLVDHVGYYTMKNFRDDGEYRALVDAIDLPTEDEDEVVTAGVDFELIQDYESDDASTVIKNIINWYDHQTAEIATGSEAIMGNASAKFVYTALPGEVMASAFYNNPKAPTISNAKGVFARVRTTVQAGAELQFIFDNYDHAGGTTVFVKLDGSVSYGSTPCDNFDGYLFLPVDDAESNLDFSLVKELGLRSTTWAGLQTAIGSVLIDHVGYYTMNYFRDEDKYRSLVDAIDLTPPYIPPVTDYDATPGVDYEIIQDYEGADAASVITDVIDWYGLQTSSLSTAEEALTGKGSAKFVYTEPTSDSFTDTAFYNAPIEAAINNPKGVVIRVSTTFKKGSDIKLGLDGYSVSTGTTVYVKDDGTVSFGWTPCDNFEGYMFMPYNDANENIDFSKVKELALLCTKWGGGASAVGTIYVDNVAYYTISDNRSSVIYNAIASSISEDYPLNPVVLKSISTGNYNNDILIDVPFQMIMVGYNTSRGTMEWTTDNPEIATIDEKGLITPLKIGTVKVTLVLTSADNATQSADCSINIVKGSIYFTLEDDKSLETSLLNTYGLIGLKPRLNAIVNYNGSNKNVEWSVVNGQADFVTIDKNPLEAQINSCYIDFKSSDNGKIIIRASLTEDATVFRDFTFLIATNYSDLEDAISKAEGISGIYNTENWTNLKAAIEKAKNTLNNESASQSDIDKAKEDLIFATEKMNNYLLSTDQSNSPMGDNFNGIILIALLILSISFITITRKSFVK